MSAVLALQTERDFSSKENMYVLHRSWSLFEYTYNFYGQRHLYLHTNGETLSQNHEVTISWKMNSLSSL